VAAAEASLPCPRTPSPADEDREAAANIASNAGTLLESLSCVLEGLAVTMTGGAPKTASSRERLRLQLRDDWREVLERVINLVDGELHGDDAAWAACLERTLLRKTDPERWRKTVFADHDGPYFHGSGALRPGDVDGGAEPAADAGRAAT
jgi:hypothetical protein